MNIKRLTDWIEYHPEVREKYSSNSNTYAHYLIEYCVDQANALRDLGIANEIIEHLMQESGATDRDFFEGQDSEVLCRLCDYEYLWSLVSEAKEEEEDEEYEDLIDDMVDEITDYCKDKIEFEDVEEAHVFVQDYIDNKDIYIPGSHTRDELIRDIAERI